jgi:hypothetical protein
MMGIDTPETCSGSRNILRISCGSSWFFFSRLYGDARSTKHKKASAAANLRSELSKSFADFKSNKNK